LPTAPYASVVIIASMKNELGKKSRKLGSKGAVMVADGGKHHTDQEAAWLDIWGCGLAVQITAVSQCCGGRGHHALGTTSQSLLKSETLYQSP